MQLLSKKRELKIYISILQDSFLGNLENLPFENKAQLKECFLKWAALEGNKETLSKTEFTGFFKELISLI